MPILRENFPDAFIKRHGGQFYAYASQGRANLQIATSIILANWTLLRDPRNPKKLHDAMPALARWAKVGLRTGVVRCRRAWSYRA